MPTVIQHLSTPGPVNMADDWYPHASVDHFWFQWRFAVLCQLLQNVDLGENVLEIGCGNGVARQQFEAKFHTPVHGCDLNERAMQCAAPAQGSLYVYNVHERRPEWKSYFHAIALLDTLEHIDRPVEFLQSVAYHLRPDGKLILNVPALPWLFSRYDVAAGHVKRYLKPRLREELRDAGMEIWRQTYWGMLLVPVLAARKIVVRFMDDDKIITKGFQPSRVADVVLRGLMHTERSLFRWPWFGTSLAAIAKRPAA